MLEMFRSLMVLQKVIHDEENKDNEERAKLDGTMESKKSEIRKKKNNPIYE